MAEVSVKCTTKLVASYKVMHMPTLSQLFFSKKYIKSICPEKYLYNYEQQFPFNNQKLNKQTKNFERKWIYKLQVILYVRKNYCKEKKLNHENYYVKEKELDQKE